ncbi:hypothetical protein Dsin_019602 [Dipteronia sinensis]|uniref:Uncharacterized protein n=1 Tax=Dipteronia sinensis TaxID=43782 RepID=A0AAE0E373_9ROSI|nr:hypothetical protein Dsin_019602 [Dipteronia sinensis]
MCKPKSEGGLGFHDLEMSNRALLAKQCWRILKNPGSLAVKVLKACYFRNGNFIEAKSNDDASFVWRSLIWGKELLKAGIRWCVGNGKSIFIYNDKWVPRPSTFKNHFASQVAFECKG